MAFYYNKRLDHKFKLYFAEGRVDGLNIASKTQLNFTLLDVMMFQLDRQPLELAHIQVVEETLRF